jgi:hypothetical protein
MILYKYAMYVCINIYLRKSIYAFKRLWGLCMHDVVSIFIYTYQVCVNVKRECVSVCVHESYDCVFNLS